MKTVVSMLLLLFIVSIILAMQIPQSSTPVFTDTNLIKDFVRIDPDDRQAETLPTQTWIWQEDNCLMVHFECVIDQDFKPGAVTPRDQTPDADFLRIQLITSPESYYAYYYCAYPTGTLLDGVRNCDMSTKYDWDSSYSYTSNYDAHTWNVTFRIPLNELRFQQNLPYQWKIILTRYSPKTKYFFSYPYSNIKQGKDYFTEAYDLELNGKIQRKLDIKFKPYYVKSYDLLAKTASFDPDHLGLDVALNPSQRTRIKVSMNPDYSDIPPDDAQDNYNSKYPPNNSESRFFFTEDIDVFESVSDYFYTRNIVQPKLAFKMTGNGKVVTWGILGAFDREIIDEGYQNNPDDYYQVMTITPTWRRLKLNANVVSRANQGYYNHLGNLNFNLEFLPKIFLGAFYGEGFRKNEHEYDPKLKQGWASSVSLQAKPGNWDAGLFYNRIDKDFTADTGWYLTTDTDNLSTSISYTSETTENAIKSYSMSGWGNFGHMQVSTEPIELYSMGANANVSFKNDMAFSSYANVMKEQDLIDDLHDTYFANGSFSFRLNEDIYLSIGGAYCKALIYQLYDTRNKLNLFAYIGGTIAAKLDFSVSGGWHSFDYDKVNIVGGNIVTLDDKYVIGNGTLVYTPGQKLQFRTGAGISSYETVGNFAQLSYYGNVRYEFMPEYFIYAGFKSRQTQDVAPNYAEPMGHFSKDQASAYIKLTATL
ncbi:hypothetical protein MASR2M64_10140 [Candidatus Cloacimonadota bacterium]|nr:hypothetical protein [Candidatus Cloacimonadota bacterium]